MKPTSMPLYLGLLLTMIAILVVGCAPGTSPVEPTDTATQVVEVVPATATATPIPPSSTPTPEPSETPTPTSSATATQTSTYTYTPTPEPAILTFNQDAVCMAGASYGHQVDHYVLGETSYPLLGGLEDQSWWLVETEDGGTCWADGKVVSVQGDFERLPVVTSPPIPSLTPTVTPQTPGIYYILVAKDTGGPIGCGDSLVKYYPGVWIKGDLEDDILGALNALFSNHNEYVNGFYNPMYRSDLRAKSVEVVGGEVIVQLGGTLVRPKDTCESQRMRAQVWYTVSQFSPTRAIIYLNKALLGDLLVVAK
jgi:hypothetical protein